MKIDQRAAGSKQAAIHSIEIEMSGPLAIDISEEEEEEWKITGI